MLQSTTEFLRNSENQTSFNRNECSIAYHSTAAHLKSIWGPKDIPKLSHYLMGRSELLASKMIWMGNDVPASDPTAVTLVENWRLYPSTCVLCASREIERKKFHPAHAIEASTLDGFLTLLSKAPQAILLVIHPSRQQNACSSTTLKTSFPDKFRVRGCAATIFKYRLTLRWTEYDTRAHDLCN